MGAFECWVSFDFNLAISHHPIHLLPPEPSMKKRVQAAFENKKAPPPVLTRRLTGLWSFEDSIEEITRLPVNELPIAKDLFRLFSRIQITQTTSAILAVSVAAVAAETAELEKEEPGLFRVWYREAVLPFAETFTAGDWGQLQLEGTIQLIGEPLQARLLSEFNSLVISTDASRVVNTEDSTRYFALVPPSVLPSDASKSCENCDDETTLCAIFCNDCKEALCHTCSSVLHRRSTKRNHVRNVVAACGIAFSSRAESAAFKEFILSNGAQAKNEINVAEESLPKIEESSGESQPIDSGNVQANFVSFLKHLVGSLDGPKLAKKVETWCKGQLHTSTNPDMEIFVAEMLRDVIPDSVTSRVLKAVNQRIALTASFHLKSTVLEGIFTCDVRDSSGWNIAIQIAPTTVSISHIRREKSMPSLPVDQQFSFTYSVRVVFDRLANHLFASSLRITKLEFGPEAGADFKALINQRLGYGSLLIQ